MPMQSIIACCTDSLNSRVLSDVDLQCLFQFLTFEHAGSEACYNFLLYSNFVLYLLTFDSSWKSGVPGVCDPEYRF